MLVLALAAVWPVRPSSAPTASFGSATHHAVGVGPVSVVLRDFNADAKLDFATANFGDSPGKISVRLGNGDGTFAAATHYTVGDHPTSIAAGDFNGDGKLDLVVSLDLEGNAIKTLLGNGNGTFGPATFVASTAMPSVGPPPVVALGDVNGDGVADLAFTNPQANTVSVMLATGNGGLNLSQTTTAGTTPAWIAIGDVNGDGKADLAVANRGSDNVSILLGNGNGTFAAAVHHDVGDYPGSVAIEHLDDDGIPDLVVANANAHSISVLYGTGGGTFLAPTNYAIERANFGSGPGAEAAAGDFNGDGRPDLVVALGDYASVPILVGDYGPFTTAILYGSESAGSVEIGDVNGDGKPDLALANYTANSVGIMLNTSPAFTSVFTDDPLLQTTTIKALHLTQVRTMVNTVRARHGLAVFPFTDSLIPASTPIRALHITELRDALGPVYDDIGVARPTYVDPTLAVGMTKFRRIHLRQLRDAERRAAAYRVVTVTKAGDGTGTVTSNFPGINCGADCKQSFAPNLGSSVVLSAGPTGVSEFIGWSGTGCALSGTNCVVSESTDAAMTATFNLQRRTLTVTKAGTGTGTVASTPPGIDCGSDCTEPFVLDTNVQLTPAADAGSRFVNWTGSCTGSGACNVTMNVNATVGATFTQQFLLTVTKNGSGSGTVTSSPAGISCGADCDQVYDHGASVTLTAAAAAGSTFAGWSGACSGNGSCIVAMNAAESVTATFTTAQSFTLTVTRSGAGTGTVTSNPAGIDCGTDCQEVHVVGTSVTLTASAPAGSYFANWTGACSGNGPCTLTMTGDLAVGAVFEVPASIDVHPRDYHMGASGGCNGDVLGVQFSVTAPAGVTWKVTNISGSPVTGSGYSGSLNQSSGSGSASVIFTVTVAAQSPGSTGNCSRWQDFFYTHRFTFRFYDSAGQEIGFVFTDARWIYRLIL